MKNINPEKLSKEETEKTKKASIVEGSAYNVMYGFGEQYVTPYAIKLGATDSQIGILSSVPTFIGSLFQILGAKLTEKYQDRKSICLIFALLQALMLLPLFVVPLFTRSMLLLTIIFSLYLIFANIGGPPWNSWIGDVILEDDREKYFAKRNKISIAVLFISVLIAGIILNYFSDVDIWIGFGILFVVAFTGRVVSWYSLAKQYEPRFVFKSESYFSFRDFIKKMPETNFGNFVIFRSIMAFTIMIASPFFAVYMLKDLNFTYIQYTAIILVPMIIKILTATFWGKYSEKLGNKRIMFISAFMIAFIPLGWFAAGYFFESSKYIFLILMAVECINGLGWGGFDLTTFNYMLETSGPQKRARAFAYFNVIFGLFVLLGGLLGAYLINIIPNILVGGIMISAILTVFFISAIARGIIPFIFIKKMREVRVNKPLSERKIFFDIFVGKPLHAAISHTEYTLDVAEKNIESMRQNTKDTLEILAKPIEPIIKEMEEFIDEGLEKVEPIRKRLEPRIIRKTKKRHHDKIIGHTPKRLRIQKIVKSRKKR